MRGSGAVEAVDIRRVEPVDLHRGERLLPPMGGGTGEKGHAPSGEANIKPQVEFVGEALLPL